MRLLVECRSCIDFIWIKGHTNRIANSCSRLQQRVLRMHSHNFAYFYFSGPFDYFGWYWYKIRLMRLTKTQYKTIDWFDKYNRSPDTQLRENLKSGRHNCITNSRTSEQYPNHWSNFIIITIDVCVCFVWLSI